MFCVVLCSPLIWITVDQIFGSKSVCFLISNVAFTPPISTHRKIQDSGLLFPLLVRSAKKNMQLLDVWWQKKSVLTFSMIRHMKPIALCIGHPLPLTVNLSTKSRMEHYLTQIFIFQNMKTGEIQQLGPYQAGSLKLLIAVLKNKQILF